MSYSTYFSNETYECRECGGSFTRDQVEDTWKCPNCEDEHIFIYCDRLSERIIIQRKFPNDLSQNDHVILPHDGKEERPRQIKGISQQDILTGKYSIGIENYTRVKVNDDEWFNCFFGKVR